MISQNAAQTWFTEMKMNDKIFEHLNNIKSVFNPSMVDLADIFKVSRQDIYKWLLRISHPETDKLDTIIYFSKISDIFRDSGVSRIPSLLKLNIYDNKCLFEYLKNGIDATDIIEDIILEEKIMDQAERKVSESLSKSKPTDHWKSYLTIINY